MDEEVKKKILNIYQVLNKILSLLLLIEKSKISIYHSDLIRKLQKEIEEEIEVLSKS
jgi:hypothetical protein